MSYRSIYIGEGRRFRDGYDYLLVRNHHSSVPGESFQELYWWERGWKISGYLGVWRIKGF